MGETGVSQRMGGAALIRPATISRRDFGKAALAAASTGSLLAKPNSKFGGVQIGIIAPYSFRAMTATGIDDLLKYIVDLGISSVELQSEPLEAYAGVPAPRPVPAGQKKGGGRSPEQQAAQRARAEEMRSWRLSVSMDKFKEVRRKFDAAGIAIPIVKFGLNTNMPDAEIEYCFGVAKAMGVRAITCEPPLSQTRRLGEIAASHKIVLGYHGHSNMTNPESFAKPESWETAMSFSRYNGANIDVGHFTAGNSFSPAEFIRKHHARITNLHLKDRRKNQGPNVPWGQGDTDIQGILQMMKREGYKFPACIELEYPVPEGSDTLAELRKCLDYCKAALA